MNIYDFDGTIYRGDSSIDFYFYVLKKKPSLVKFLPTQFGGVFLYLCGIIDKTQMKERFFCFLTAVNSSELVETFWDENQRKVYGWYLAQHRDEDIIISASPEFLLRPICDRLGITCLIASKADPHTGRFEGENCRGKEKAVRLRQEYSVTHFEKFYSDSKTDQSLAEMAEQAFLVKKGMMRRWPGNSRQNSCPHP
ncbi:MAG: HAD-IB family phosphatase [Lachnospiraceae bacterium]|nr:HAD-IB family phosphatase [Lachnospiraceae bacterium]